MSVYIDKNELETRISNFIESSKRAMTEETLIYSKHILDGIKLTPTADVIERSKVNKAIEEITDIIAKCDKGYGLCQVEGIGVRQALDILKKHIGEVRE